MNAQPNGWFDESKHKTRPGFYQHHNKYIFLRRLQKEFINPSKWQNSAMKTCQKEWMWWHVHQAGPTPASLISGQTLFDILREINLYRDRCGTCHNKNSNENKYGAKGTRQRQEVGENLIFGIEFHGLPFPCASCGNVCTDSFFLHIFFYFSLLRLMVWFDGFKIESHKANTVPSTMQNVSSFFFLCISLPL